MEIKSAAGLIQLMGGQSVVTRELKAMGAEISGPAAVSRWIKVDAIPAQWWSRLIIIGVKAGLNLDAEKMLTLYDGEKIDV